MAAGCNFHRFHTAGDTVVHWNHTVRLDQSRTDRIGLGLRNLGPSVLCTVVGIGRTDPYCTVRSDRTACYRKIPAVVGLSDNLVFLAVGNYCTPVDSPRSSALAEPLVLQRFAVLCHGVVTVYLQMRNYWCDLEFCAGLQCGG